MNGPTTLDGRHAHWRLRLLQLLAIVILALGAVELATVGDFQRAATTPPKGPEIATPGLEIPVLVLTVLGLVFLRRLRRG